jgi:hypothetical protein
MPSSNQNQPMGTNTQADSAPSFDAQGNQGAPGQYGQEGQYGAVRGGGLGGALNNNNNNPSRYEGMEADDSN